jgi:hypothetical protein
MSAVGNQVVAAAWHLEDERWPKVSKSTDHEDVAHG